MPEWQLLIPSYGGTEKKKTTPPTVKVYIPGPESLAPYREPALSAQEEFSKLKQYAPKGYDLSAEEQQQLIEKSPSMMTPEQTRMLGQNYGLLQMYAKQLADQDQMVKDQLRQAALVRSYQTPELDVTPLLQFSDMLTGGNLSERTRPALTQAQIEQQYLDNINKVTGQQSKLTGSEMAAMRLLGPVPGSGVTETTGVKTKISTPTEKSEKDPYEPLISKFAKENKDLVGYKIFDNRAKDLLMSKTMAGDYGFIRNFLNFSGEAGRLSDRDLTTVSPSQEVRASLARLLNKRFGQGTLFTDKDRSELRSTLDRLADTNTTFLDQTIEGWSRSLPSNVSPDEFKRRVRARYVISHPAGRSEPKENIFIKLLEKKLGGSDERK